MNAERVRRSASSSPALFALLALCWGTSFVAIEAGLAFVPPLLFAAGRYYVAGAVLVGYAAVTTERWLPRTRDDLLSIGLVGGLVIAGYHGLLYLGETYVAGAVAAVVVSLAPVLTAGFAGALLTDRGLDAVDGAGLATGVAGVGLVAGVGPNGLGSAAGVGAGLVFLGAAAFALGSVVTRPLDLRVSLPGMEGWAMVAGAGLLHLGGLARGERLAAVEPTPTAVATFVYLALVSGVVGFLVYFALVERQGPTEINLVGYAEPVVAALAGWVLLGHAVDGATAVGFLVIFGSFLTLKRDAVEELVTDDAGGRVARFTNAGD